MKKKNFNEWPIKIRRDFDRNYWSLWDNLETVRLDIGPTIALSPDRPEFVDVGLGTRCNLNCKFCYTEATASGQDWTNVCETWKAWMDTFPPDVPVTPDNIDYVLADILRPDPTDRDPENLLFRLKTSVGISRKGAVYTEKPTQIAIGSTGEPTIHPDFPRFLEAVYQTGVVPNYTTNGILLADPMKGQEVLEATRQYVGGVAVSFGNRSVRSQAEAAVRRLVTDGECKVMIHHLIGSKEDVDEVFRLNDVYGPDVHYHVLLPLMAHGRSGEAMEMNTYDYLVEQVHKSGITNLAFGANFAPFMRQRPGSLPVWETPDERYSENILLREGKVVITPSSFDLTPIKILDLTEKLQ